MKRFFGRYKQHDLFFFSSVCLFFLLQLALIARTKAVFWDEAVFLSMGKAVYSHGTSGLWEVIRPPLLPLLIALTHITAAPALITKIMLVTIICVSAVCFYLLLRETVRPWIAALAATLLLFTPLWFSYANLVLTDILSAALIIIACYLFRHERYALAGVCSTLAFLTRFPAGIVIVCLAAIGVIARKPLRDTFALVGSFGAIVGLWFFSNYVLWRNTVAHSYEAALRPLLLGFTTAAHENVGMYTSQHGFYIYYLLGAMPIAVCAVYGALHWRRHLTLLPLAATSVLLLIFFEWLPNDQERFALLMLPGILVLVAMGLHDISLLRWRHAESILYGILALSITVGIIADIALVSRERTMDPALVEYYSYFARNPVQGTVLVTSPLTAWYIPNKAVPVYFGQFTQTSDQLSSVAAVQYESQNILCVTEQCIAEHTRIEEEIARNFTLVYNRTYEQNEYKIYVRS